MNDGNLPLGYSLEDQIRCVDREVEMRARVYKRWVADGKMRQEKADWETGCMTAVLATLRAMGPR